MSAYLDRSMSSLASASSDLSQEGSTGKSLGLVQGLIEFLDRYEGKKPIKPELKQMAMQYSHLHPWAITVTRRKDGAQVESRINVSSFECLGAVRERCAKVFGLELNEFHMQMKSGFIDPDKDDDRYVKDHDMSLHIYLTPNQAYDKRAHPKYLVSANQDYFEQLFSLLSKNNASLTESVWNLLQKIPINAKLHHDLSQLEGAKENWDKLLDSKSTHKLLYSLKIIEELKFSEQPAQSEEPG